MGRIDVDEVYLKTKEHYNQAKKTLQEIEHFLFEHADAISDTIPGYKAEYLEFGSYEIGRASCRERVCLSV